MNLIKIMLVLSMILNKERSFSWGIKLSVLLVRNKLRKVLMIVNGSVVRMISVLDYLLY